ncbi:MAG: TylF/MycF/NovP-related O-methyltransferase [Ferruginibacter sp.]
MKKTIIKMIKRLGYAVHKIHNNEQPALKDIKDQAFWDIYDSCKPYTMTSVERMYGLYNSVNYVLRNNIPGAFVECGVWRGGSAMLIAKLLLNNNICDRKIYLYDTFDGMTDPTGEDINLNGVNASLILQKKESDKKDQGWCIADLADVQNNMQLTNYPPEHIVYIKGKVEETIPAVLPDKEIALLRLDTDWYESTKHELIHLFPMLETNGIIIIDDYGHWEGCKKAVDDYFNEHKINILLNRIDYTCRVGIKNSSN